jgi:hypothetical protein
MCVSSTADIDVGPYNNESMITLQFNEAGDEVVTFTEFFDSIVSRDFLSKLYGGQNGTTAEVHAEKQIEGVVFWAWDSFVNLAERWGLTSDWCKGLVIRDVLW